VGQEFFWVILLFIVYTLVDQELDFFSCDFTIHSLYICGPGFRFFVCDFAVHNLYSYKPRVGLFRVFYFLLMMNSLGLYLGACSSSCLQGKWCFKNLPLPGPCWKSLAFSRVYGALVDPISALRS